MSISTLFSNVFGATRAKQLPARVIPRLLALEERLNPVGGVLPVAPVYASVNGVLHVKFTASSTTATIDGTTYDGVYTTAPVLVTGNVTPGVGTSAYIQPVLQLQRGDTLIVDYGNDLPMALVNGVENEQGINLHLHGLHVETTGRADNVSLIIAPGAANRYQYTIGQDQSEGLYWYHNHKHMFTNNQTYLGLAGLLVVGRADGNYSQFNTIQQRSMQLNYNVVAPSNGQLALPGGTKNSTCVVGDVTYPGGQMAYTVNGESNARVGLQPGENQIWSIANINNNAYFSLALDSVPAGSSLDDFSTVGTPVNFVVVAVDGEPLQQPMTINAFQNQQGYLLAAGGRVSIMVTGPASGQVLRLKTFSQSNGFNQFSSDILAVSDTTIPSLGNSIPTPTTLTTNNQNFYENLATATVNYSRSLSYDQRISTASAPNNFPADNGLFPNNPIRQPILGTVEEWTYVNNSTDHHPIHIHEAFQVMQIIDPNNPANNIIIPRGNGQDVIDLPPALLDANGAVIVDANGNAVSPGKVVLRIRFSDYLGGFVQHCHRLNHEDRGMMTQIKVIPIIPIYATGASAGTGSTVTVFNSLNNSVMKTFEAFPGYMGGVSVAVADVNNDSVMDVIVGSQGGAEAHVIAYSGASNFTTVLQSYFPFAGFTGSLSVAGGDLNADGFDDVIVGAGAGGQPRVLATSGKTGAVFVNFFAYDQGFTGGVAVAAGIVNDGGLVSLITGSGPGAGPHVCVYNFSPYGTVTGLPFNNQTIWTPYLVSSYFAFDEGYLGGVSVAVGVYGGEMGGFGRILVGALAGQAHVSVFGVMESMDYGSDGLMNGPIATPQDHIEFEQMASFFVYAPEQATGVRLGSISTLVGADIVVTAMGGSGSGQRLSYSMDSDQPLLVDFFFAEEGAMVGGA